MTKIKDYLADSTVSKTDKLIGTDSVDNTTKTYTVESLGNFIQKLPTALQSLSGTAVDVVAGSSKIVILTEASGNITVNLHSSVDNDGVMYYIVAENGNGILLNPFDAELVDGLATTTTVGKMTVFAHDGHWHTI
tara:strand:+ start:394 stop:798 length:405 start_codon:yes stop_codon:yes gene_type:complete